MNALSAHKRKNGTKNNKKVAPAPINEKTVQETYLTYDCIFWVNPDLPISLRALPISVPNQPYQLFDAK